MTNVLADAEIISLNPVALGADHQSRIDAAYLLLQDAANHLNGLRQAIARAEQDALRADGRLAGALEWVGCDPKLGTWRWDGEHIQIDSPPVT